MQDFTVQMETFELSVELLQLLKALAVHWASKVTKPGDRNSEATGLEI